MPFSAGIPLGLLLIIMGVFLSFVTRRNNKIWVSIVILGALISLGTFVVIFLAVNSM